MKHLNLKRAVEKTGSIVLRGGFNNSTYYYAKNNKNIISWISHGEFAECVKVRGISVEADYGTFTKQIKTAIYLFTGGGA